MDNGYKKKIDHRIHPFFSQFKDHKLEHQFRQHTILEDKKSGTILVFISIVALIVITLFDYQNHGVSALFFKVAIPKVFLALIISVILFLLQRTDKEYHFDILLLVFSTLFIIFKIYTGQLRPTGYLPGVAFDIVIIMAVYLVLPIRIGFRVIPALILTFLSPFVVVAKILLIPHLFAHCIGAFFARILSKNRRIQFFLLLTEIELKKELKNSESEIQFITERLAEQNKILKEYSTKDQLTGIHNRRSFREFTEQQWSKAIRRKEDCGIILFDIDHFKNINDTYGHLVGDRVLQGVVSLIEELIRPYDKFCRWGGEEFILYLPDTDIKQTQNIAERLKKSVQEEKFSIENNIINVTISLGVSSKKTSNTVVLEEIFDHADKALYAAKKTGRNKVCRFIDLPE